jgi:hypothetical protein
MTHFGNSLMAAAIAAMLSTAAGAQVQTSKSVATGTPEITTTVERGEVVRVSGNNLIVKMPDGTVRDFPDIPESATVNVGGQPFGIHNLRPGMKLQRTITTTSTPAVITTVATVRGNVFQVMAPSSVILTLEDGTNQKFTIPKDQKFNVDGQVLDAFGLKKGMVVVATKIIEVPETQVAVERSVTGALPALAALPSDQPILILRAQK